jgi:hypothetical protein
VVGCGMALHARLPAARARPPLRNAAHSKATCTRRFACVVRGGRCSRRPSRAWPLAVQSAVAGLGRDGPVALRRRRNRPAYHRPRALAPLTPVRSRSRQSPCFPRACVEGSCAGWIGIGLCQCGRNARCRFRAGRAGADGSVRRAACQLRRTPGRAAGTVRTSRRGSATARCGRRSRARWARGSAC